MSQLEKLAITIFCLFLVSSCGQTGPLYVPESSTLEDADISRNVDQNPQSENNNDN